MEARQPFFRRATRSFAAHGARAPLGLLLTKLRRAASDEILCRYQDRAAEIEQRLQRADADARADLAVLAEGALDEMRGLVRAWAAEQSTGAEWAASIDAWWHRADAVEYLDDPHLDERLRVRILENLDKMNDLLGSYSVFFRRLLPLLPRGRPVRVLDLAAGHGGFALALAEMARGAGVDMELCATDIKREYLELGRARAAELDARVEFRVQDALDLSNVEPNRYDFVVCTQSLHHFTPGQVAVMFEEASRVARGGVLFIDGARSALNAAMIASLSFLVYRHPAFAHDTFVSFRRFFVPEELELLARLGPWGTRARADWTPPGHCVLELVKLSQ